MLNDILNALILGITLGLTPGPIIFLLISETLNKGSRGGLSVLIGTLLVDTSIIIPVSLIASLIFQDFQLILRVLGGTFLILIGILTIRNALLGANHVIKTEFPSYKTEDKRNDINPKNLRSTFSEVKVSFLKGLMFQILNPMAYIFWVTVGISQTLVITNEYGSLFFFLFPLTFWIAIVSVELFWVLLAVKAQSVLSSRWYSIIQVCCGLILIYLGLMIWFTLEQIQIPT
ncbi:MAG: LysE family transporter [Candidatus Heimdallarchaeota archaeon]|nr:MAG: LysE family transporter [Candidatus Heimdallarchaeota archaeon]